MSQESNKEENQKGAEGAQTGSEAQSEIGSAAADVAGALEKAQADMLYLRAEFENYKRRILREQEQAVKFANEKLVGDILGVVDLFERAIASAANLKNRGDAEVTGFVTGVEMTHRELSQLLNRFGVEFIGSVGEKFDPIRHEAISQQETSADKADTVLGVLQKGCSLHGRLLKPAKVLVGVHH